MKYDMCTVQAAQGKDRIQGGITPARIKELVGHNDPIFLEIGCNNGLDTLKFLNVFGGGRFYCFEPDPRPAANFRKNIDDPRVKFYEVAISDKDGSALMFRSSGVPPAASKSRYCPDGDWDLSGSIVKPTGHLEFSPWTTFPPEIRLEVPTMRLDTWLRQLERNDRLEASKVDFNHGDTVIDFIWADVQGAEALLIRGARETLNHTRWFATEYYNMSLYEGQPDLATICKMLPQFDLHSLYTSDDALFKHKRL